MSNPIFDGLNDKQKEAVEILSGPLLILAGAGSGKTKCLTHRIANLIANGTPPHKILAVTFTNKAANEMKDRVEKLLKELESETHLFASPPTVGTFHAICVRMLREDIETFGGPFSRQFVIFDTSDTQSLMKLLIKESPFDEKEIKFKAVLNHISAAKNLLITPQEHFKNLGLHSSNRLVQAVEHLFPQYQRRLEEHNALDFDDLLQKTVQLLEKYPQLLEKYQTRWDHVLVDEYQDTNFAQYRLIRLLVEKHNNLCVIGDDHQSIYSFRGADYTNILNFENDFPDAKTVKLEQNYRSTKNILANANNLIERNQTGHPKKLWTENESGDRVKVIQVTDEKDEGNYIAKLIQQSEKRHSDIAILYRMNAQSRAIEEAFMRHQIPYQIVGGTRFFDRMEIKDIIAYLRLVFNPKDNLAFLRIINTPTRKLGAATIETVKQYAIEYNMGLLEMLEHIDEIDALTSSKKVTLKNFYHQVEDWKKLADKKSLSDLIEQIVEDIDYFTYLDDGTMEGEMRQQNVKELLSVALRYESSETPLASFLEGIALMSDVDNMENQESVTLMTVHASKGLEFPMVFLPGWEDGMFPGSQSQFDPDSLEEERRLGYVAITRAEESCHILHAQQRMIFGKTEYTSPSPFLNELKEECVEILISDTAPARNNWYGGRRQQTKSYLEPFSDETPENFVPNTSEPSGSVFGSQEKSHDYNISDRVHHKEFGAGTIINVSGDVLTVVFESAGMKKIVGSIAPIEKI